MSSLDTATVAKRYSRALFEVLSEKDELTSGAADLQAIRQIFLSNPKLGLALSDNSLSESDRKALLQPMLDNASTQTVKNFIEMVFDYARMTDIVAIIDQFEILNDEANKTVHADITSAVPLSEEQEQRISQAFAKRVGANKVILNSTVDADILGGVVLQSSGVTYDGSVKAKLNKIRRMLLN
ncbi:ATP synthase F1 subunit delta [Levilactobacillus bambusae]|uniref:ATP synthase subunit delta n=1 Tax=Levilactobacillus bambusae TaxID=2024736 RepID=A0A2V1MZH4_9LACO|nr:ATP synthase F1 subunit delta [Levilactobacillus bambusae]PWF99525.1 F0F1 ATP synthase subunit delta [Levilactobacillus bambusae]